MLSVKERKKQEKEAKQKAADDRETSALNIQATCDACGCNTSGLLLDSCIREARALGDMATFVVFKKKAKPPDVRAQMPGWDPALCRVETLDSRARAASLCSTRQPNTRVLVGTARRLRRSGRRRSRSRARGRSTRAASRARC